MARNLDRLCIAIRSPTLIDTRINGSQPSAYISLCLSAYAIDPDDIRRDIADYAVFVTAFMLLAPARRRPFVQRSLAVGNLRRAGICLGRSFRLATIYCTQLPVDHGA